MKKRFLGGAATALLAAALFVTGCANSAGDVGVASYSEGEAGSGEPGNLTLAVKSHTTSSRTILPSNWDGDHGDGLIYVLTGTSGEYSVPEDTTFTYGQLTGAGAKIKLEPAVWDLTLTGYQKAGDAADTGKPSLKGSLSGIDLTVGSQSVIFNLDPVYDGTEAEGEVVVDVSFKINDDLKYVTYGVYNDQKGTDPVDEKAGGKGDENGYTADTEKNGQIEYDGNVKPGENYWFVAKFWNGSDTTSAKCLGTIVEPLVVDGGNISKASFDKGDFLNKKADNPTNFKITTSYADGTAPSADKVDKKFTAKFEWTDMANNEEGFELVLTKDGSAWRTFNATSTDAEIVEGNLKPDSVENRSCTLSLDTGHVYTATIRAYNVIDKDDETDVPTGNPVINDNATIGKFGMFSVAYDRGNNAEVIVNTKDNKRPSAPIYVVGYNYLMDAQALMPAVNKEDTEPTAAPFMQSTTDGYKFLWWYKSDDDTKSKYSEDNKIAIGNKDNIELTALWAVEMTVNANFPCYKNANIKVVESCVANTTTEPVPTSGVVIKATRGKDVVFKVNAGITDPTATIFFNGKTVADADVTTVSGAEITWKTDNSLKVGTYDVLVSGKLSYTDSSTGAAREITIGQDVQVKFEK